MDRMEKLSHPMEALDPFFQAQEGWKASVFTDTQHLSLDSEDPVTVIDGLKADAPIDDIVEFVGRSPTFQRWNPEKFTKFQEMARQRLRERRESSPMKHLMHPRMSEGIHTIHTGAATAQQSGNEEMKFDRNSKKDREKDSLGGEQ